jgi:GGDEF domain-containing protein
MESATSRQLTLLSCSGGSDAVFRYGGDEFLIIFADTSLLRAPEDGF